MSAIKLYKPNANRKFRWISKIRTISGNEYKRKTSGLKAKGKSGGGFGEVTIYEQGIVVKSMYIGKSSDPLISYVSKNNFRSELSVAVYAADHGIAPHVIDYFFIRKTDGTLVGQIWMDAYANPLQKVQPLFQDGKRQKDQYGQLLMEVSDATKLSHQEKDDLNNIISRMHGIGIFHNDLYPKNVLVITNLKEKRVFAIADFGLSLVMNGQLPEKVSSFENTRFWKAMNGEHMGMTTKDMHDVYQSLMNGFKKNGDAHLKKLNPWTFISRFNLINGLATLGLNDADLVATQMYVLAPVTAYLTYLIPLFVTAGVTTITVLIAILQLFAKYKSSPELREKIKKRKLTKKDAIQIVKRFKIPIALAFVTGFTYFFRLNMPESNTQFALEIYKKSFLWA